ncbi:hypothetical protein Lbir_0353 [Legionella birminghamensis]|uniref:Uncharacterized protein n=1 Tax=Legionella birminghamensis TaxID=28083 RepID=A0A378ICL3_9GAMM|nr:hypothetical protein [Legionella birminghamensis]KTC75441.1 hypothetical protein Lbir_0353 [Legionella birminghamensis]STX32666.1 Uncharacterised protein [Legionella birminghamensis]
MLKQFKLTGTEIILSNHDDTVLPTAQRDENSQNDKLIIRVEAGCSILPINQKLSDYQEKTEALKLIDTVLFQDSNFNGLKNSPDEINNLLEILKKLPKQTRRISFCFSNLGELGFDNVFRIAETVAQTLGEGIKELDLRACKFNYLHNEQRKKIEDLFPEGVLKLTKWQVVVDSHSPDDENENEENFCRIYQYDHKEIGLGKTIVSSTTKDNLLMVSYTSLGSNEGDLIIHPRHKMTNQEVEQRLGYRRSCSMSGFPNQRWDITLDTRNEGDLDYFITILDDNEPLEELSNEIYDFLELKPSPEDVFSSFERGETKAAIEQLKVAQRKGRYFFILQIADYYFEQLITSESETSPSGDELYEIYNLIPMDSPYYHAAQMRKLEILDTQGNSRELSKERFTVALGYKPQAVVDQTRVDMVFHELSGKDGAPDITNIPSVSALLSLAEEMNQLRQELTALRAYKAENEARKRKAGTQERSETCIGTTGIFGPRPGKRGKTELNAIVSPDNRCG